MKVTLKAKSSSGDPYDVDFLFEGGALSVHCTCRAGIMRTACKHRLSLLKGDQKMLADPSQANELATVVEWASKVGFSNLIQRLDEAEAELSRVQREVKKGKKRLEESMTHGLSPGS